MFLEDKTVLITGGGSLGRELIALLLDRGVHSIRVLDNSEQSLFKCECLFRRDGRVSYFLGDVGNYDDVELSMPGVDYIIHTAASKFINYVEYHPFKSIRTNVDGTINVIKAVIKAPSVRSMINISSDKACNPASIYGLTKALQERLIMWASRVSHKNFCSIRFPNFIDSDGSVFKIWKNQAEAGTSLTITDEKMTRHFISIPRAAELTLEALKASKGGEIFLPADIKAKNIMELAKEYGDNFKFIGKRLGERLHEAQMTDEERERAVRQGTFWIIDTKRDYIGTPHYLYDTYHGERQ